MEAVASSKLDFAATFCARLPSAFVGVCVRMERSGFLSVDRE